MTPYACFETRASSLLSMTKGVDVHLTVVILRSPVRGVSKDAMRPDPAT
jgi:hypothetical protein